MLNDYIRHFCRTHFLANRLHQASTSLNTVRDSLVRTAECTEERWRSAWRKRGGAASVSNLVGIDGDLAVTAVGAALVHVHC